uniref:Uncharacterized protein n=1 Tax=Pyrodinium bahamense TaxID=73915 RepID=A0A7S0FL89_9DINO|mmetsp:Transcript_36633/g.101733  ORF Transcript_36633/g.101733 Transcript_36633/m.101733 type:complete len:108 (+) Transcript_36633:91-414(+)
MVLVRHWHGAASAHPSAFAYQDALSYTVNRIPEAVGKVSMTDVYGLIDQSRAVIAQVRAKLAQTQGEAWGGGGALPAAGKHGGARGVVTSRAAFLGVGPLVPVALEG